MKNKKGGLKMHYFLILAFLLCLTGCGNSNNNNNEKNQTNPEITKEIVESEEKISDLSSDWKEMEFLVNDAKLSIPCNYKELEKATGCVLENNNVTSLDAYDSEYFDVYINDEISFSILLENNTNKTIDCGDATIGAISQNAEDAAFSDFDVAFPGNLINGQKITHDDAVALFGEPTSKSTSDYDNNTFETYYYEEDTDEHYKTFEIWLFNGKIDELVLQYYEY